MKHPHAISQLLAVGLEPGEASDQLDFSDIPDGKWRVGGYELLERIGANGRSNTFRARQPHSNRVVAVKRLPKLGSKHVDTLRQQVKVLSNLRHPHILPIYEVGLDEEGIPFISMRLVSGGNLADWIQNEKHDIHDLVEVLVKVTRTLQAAQKANPFLVDDGITPENILFDRVGEPLIAGFSIAHRHSQLVGAQFHRKTAKSGGNTANIFHLGKILETILKAQVSDVSHQTAQAQSDLEKICALCLSRNSSEGYQNLSDLAEHLQCWLDGRPIVTRPFERPNKNKQWLRRIIEKVSQQAE